MRVAVLGAGAVGLTIAAKLSQVCDVHAVSRVKHVNAINKRGFILTGIWGEETFGFSSSDGIPVGETYDYVIITSKSTDTRQICEKFQDVIADTEVLSLQNGIGNEEIISEYTSRVIGGIIITGFEWRGDAMVNVSVEAGPVKLGRFSGGLDHNVRVLVDLFKEAGLNVSKTENIRGDIWGKTLYNCALNPLGAIMGVSYGELVNPYAWYIIEDVVHEVFLVAGSEGIRLQWDSPDEYLTFLHDVQVPSTALHHSSMYQDLKLGRRTEIDFINGAVVSIGSEHNILTPVNRTLCDLIRFRESLPEMKESAPEIK